MRALQKRSCIPSKDNPICVIADVPLDFDRYRSCGLPEPPNRAKNLAANEALSRLNVSESSMGVDEGEIIVNETGLIAFVWSFVFRFMPLCRARRGPF